MTGQDSDTKQTFFDRRITRREFAAVGAALGVAGTLSGVVPGRAAAQQKGGHLRLGVGSGSTTDSFDPTIPGGADTNTYAMNWCIRNNLVELDSDRRPIPELAESWEVNSDVTEWVFNLRKGVTFHNGKTLDAKDVVYSLARHITEDSKSPAKSFLADIRDIKIESPHQVRIRLASGSADFHHMLGDFQLPIVPDGFSDWEHPVGTGGYILEHWEPGVRALFKRYPDYWKSDRAWVDSVEFLTIHDPNARVTSLLTGSVDVVDFVDYKVANRVGRAPGISLVRSPGGHFNTTVMFTHEGPFADNNVRLAFKHAMKRDEMVKTLLSGFGVVGNDHPIPSNDPYHHSELPQRPYDPERAKWHLKQAGLDAIEADLYTSIAAFSGAIDAGVLLQEAGQAAGIKINVKQTPADGYWSDIWMKKPFCIVYWGVRPTPDMAFTLTYRSNGSWNDSFWGNEKFDQLLLQARVTLDFDKRKQMYWDMQEMIYETGGHGVFMFPDLIDAYSPRVKGASQDGVKNLMGARVAERVWLEG